MIISSFHIITLYFIQTNPMFYSSEDFFSNIYLSFTLNVCIFLAFFLLFVFLLRFATGIEQAPRELRKRHRDSSERTPVESERYSEKRQQRNQNRRKRNCGGMYLCVCVVCICVHANKKGLENKQQHKHKRRQKPAQREREREFPKRARDGDNSRWRQSHSINKQTKQAQQLLANKQTHTNRSNKKYSFFTW